MVTLLKLRSFVLRYGQQVSMRICLQEFLCGVGKLPTNHRSADWRSPTYNGIEGRLGQKGDEKQIAHAPFLWVWPDAD